MLDSNEIAAFSAHLRGDCVQPGEAGYDEARRVYNAMIDRHPRLIVYAADRDDVARSVGFAREHSLLLALRSGGHHGAGFGVCDGGMVLDLSRLNGVQVDAAARSARVGAGCKLADLDRATHAHGLATPTGVVGSTGIAGLTLGAGIGHLSRRYGLTIDNLLGAEVVLADGRCVEASADANPDLYWALRGGGGNFGVVTTFTLRLHPLSQVVAGPTFWPIERCADVMRWYREFILRAPPELNGFFAICTVPPVAPYPEPLQGRTVCGVVWCWCGEPGAEAPLLAAVTQPAEPLLHALQPMPLPALQGAFDALYPSGLHWYWRGDFVAELSDAAIAAHLRHGAELPTPASTMHLYPIDAAVHAHANDASAFAWRDANWALVIAGISPDGADAARLAAWTRAYWEAVHPYGCNGAYVNFMMDEGDARVRAAYRGNHARLVEIKRRYDPGNLFRMNQNIRPD